MIKYQNKIGLWVALAVQGFSLQNLKREEGQTLAEYAMILALIAILVVTALTFLQGQISSLFSKIGSQI